MKNIYTPLIALCITAISTQAQNIGINSTGATPVASAMLDVASTSKGVLIPNVALTATNAAGPITAPATSLLVYNTATAGVSPNNVLPGYYYWDGAKWVSLGGGTGGKDWSLLGNAGTTAGTNFIGTTDAIDFITRTNNIERIRVLSGGNVGIGTTTPLEKLHIGAGNIRLDNNQALNWLANTDGANITFNSTGDGAGLSALTIETIDNSDEPILFKQTGNERLRIHTNGFIGVATNAPTNTLDVNGTARIRTMAAGVTADDVLTADATGVVTRTTKTIFTNANAWALLGNNGTIAGTNFIGTTDAVDLIFKRNSVLSGMIGATNTALGTLTFTNVTGIRNTAMGTQSLQNVAGGNSNTALGAQSLQSTTGTENNAVGYRAGFTNTTGNFNSFLGSFADVSTNNLTKAVAIGYNAKVNASNAMVLGGTGADAVNVGIALTTPAGRLHLYEAIGATLSSTVGSFILEHGDNGGQSSILFKSAVNATSDYGYIKYSDDGSGNGSSTENSLLEIGVQNDVVGGVQDDIALMPSGNVGVSTITPTTKLDVNGNVRIRTTAIGAITDDILTADATGVVTRTTKIAYNNVNAWTLLGNSGTAPATNFIGTTDAVDFVTRTNNVERMRVLSGGNVGIGTVTPLAKLDVNGTSRANRFDFTPDKFGGSGDTWWIEAKTNGGEATYLEIGTSNDADDNIALMPSGNVGIGTTVPATKLDVTSATITTATFRSTSTDPFGIVDIITPVTNAACNTCTEMINFRKADGTLIGSVVANLSGNSVAYNTTSDSRLKENIHTTAFGINDLMKIQVADYNRIGNATSLLETGYIAQQLHSIYPQAVTPGGENPKTNPWGVDYGRITPLIVKAVQDVNTEVEALKLVVKQKSVNEQTQQEQIDALLLQNKELIKRLDKLEQK
jgi:hypothetical protein